MVRDPHDSENDLCQLALTSTDKADLTHLIELYEEEMLTHVFDTSSRRKRRAAAAATATPTTSHSTTTATANYTCTKLKQLGEGVIALSSTQLAKIKQSEFVSCITSLGLHKHWSTTQLSALATLAIGVT